MTQRKTKLETTDGSIIYAEVADANLARRLKWKLNKHGKPVPDNRSK